jgi:hypothetical protein
VRAGKLKFVWMSQWPSAALELEKKRTQQLRELSEESITELLNLNSAVGNLK